MRKEKQFIRVNNNSITCLTKKRNEKYCSRSFLLNIDVKEEERVKAFLLGIILRDFHIHPKRSPAIVGVPWYENYRTRWAACNKMLRYGLPKVLDGRR